MARLFIYEDAIEVTLPATIFYDTSQLSYSGYGNASDRFSQWIGSGLTYTPGQLEPTNGTLSYFSFNYNGSPLYIVDNANTTISEAVSWSRQYDPSITNNNYSVLNFGLAAVSLEPGSAVFGSSGNDLILVPISDHVVAADGQDGTDTYVFSRTYDNYTFSDFNSSLNYVQVNGGNSTAHVDMYDIELFRFGDGTVKSYSEIYQDVINSQSVSSESTDSNVSTNNNVSTNDVVAFLINQANEIISGSSTVTKLQITGSRGDYSISRNSDGDSWTMSASNIGTDTLQNFKRLEFSDGTLALDIDAGETAGQAYRLYQAAFARTPDMPGVAYHMNDMESNGLSIQQIASNFMASPEFKNMYGENPTDDEYINALYQNVLGRGASDAEVAYYQDHFDRGIWDRPQVMINFAESPENINLVGPDILNGIWLPD